MNHRLESHLFWGSHSPLSSLVGVCLIIMASARFALALICTCALIWVYGLTVLIFSRARKLMPVQGVNLILLFLSTFLCGVFIFILNFINPLAALGTGYFLILIPPLLLGSGILEASKTIEPVKAFSRALLEAVVFSGIILGMALIREPLGIGTLSFPAGIYGITEISGEAGFVPLRILSVSAGGILLFGYLIALYRFLRERNENIQRESK